MEKDAAAPKTFAIPAEFLSAFQGEVRFFPPYPPVAGYITFDREMLAAILTNQDPTSREMFAAKLRTLDPQWNIVLVAATEAKPVAL